ncbi:hypothetical protein HMPREF9554_00190, partial [Treponema phagedenis F0421]
EALKLARHNFAIFVRCIKKRDRVIKKTLARSVFSTFDRITIDML